LLFHLVGCFIAWLVGWLVGWAVNESDQFRYPASRVKLAEALLLPWRQTMPAEPLQNRIIAFLLKHYGDPRIGKNLWQGVSLEAQQVFNKWIAGKTLDLFFRILKRTADSIWEYRQKFWTAYYRAGYLDEVWLALGPDATTALRTLDDTKSLKAAKLLDCLKNQSVLLIRIGPMIFCEWSHDGRLRAQRIDARGAPVMYRSYYEAEALRFQSLDFNDGQTQDPGLVHFSSQKGGWQARARALICSFITSPQAGAPTSPVPTLGSFLSREPTLRGFSKWSTTCRCAHALAKARVRRDLQRRASGFCKLDELAHG
jgi:hypothetical protein